MTKEKRRIFYRGTIEYSEIHNRYFLKTGVTVYKLYDGTAHNVFTNNRISEFDGHEVILEGLERAPLVLNVYGIRKNR